MRRLRWRACALWALALVLPLAAAAAEDDFLDPEKAFAFSARVLDARTIEARWTIADGYFMYREKVSFAADNGVTLGAPELPRGKIKFDTNFNKDVETHRDELVVRIPVATGGGAFTLTAHSQGCADRGLCYPPQAQTAQLVLVASSAAVPPAAQTDEGRIEAALKSGSLAAVMPLFLLLGLLLAFTPCVLPMVPILSSIIVGQSAQDAPMSKARGLSLAAAYSLGMAIVYTAMGVAAGLAGEGLAAALQTPAVLAAFAAALVLLALSMFGFYELQLPASLQAKLAGISNNQRGGSYAGVFVMGAVSALIVGPCVAAPLAGALLYISQTKDVVVGGAALFSMAAGMSVPLLLVGVSAGSLLPRAGAWMEGVKKFFGALLIAVAIWMVSPVIPAWAHMLAWAALFIVSAAYLSAFDPLPAGASGWRRLWKGVGALLAIAGTVQIVGVATGGRDVLQPLQQLAARPGAATAVAVGDAKSRWLKVASVAELDAAIAANRGRVAMLDFYADWCVSCIEMERFTFHEQRVAQRLGRMLLIQADVTKNTPADKELLKRFRLFGPPGIIFFDPQGREVEGGRVIGFQNADAFLATIERAMEAATTAAAASTTLAVR
ncbi:MAG: protein-disulfide reductase DsbD [Burkholderiaceae bacterium]|nr:protein-disulfide reductase DsbD [Burkholderiaceae bacterium]